MQPTISPQPGVIPPAKTPQGSRWSRRTVIEALVVVVLLGVIGWLIWERQSSKSADRTLTADQSSISDPAGETQEDPNTEPATPSQSAESFVQNFIKANRDGDKALVNSMVSPRFQQYFIDAAASPNGNYYDFCHDPSNDPYKHSNTGTQLCSFREITDTDPVMGWFDIDKATVSKHQEKLDYGGVYVVELRNDSGEGGRYNRRILQFILSEKDGGWLVEDAVYLESGYLWY